MTSTLILGYSLLRLGPSSLLHSRLGWVGSVAVVMLYKVLYNRQKGKGEENWRIVSGERGNTHIVGNFHIFTCTKN